MRAPCDAEAGAQTHPADPRAGKATDENLTSENWEFILVSPDSRTPPLRPAAPQPLLRTVLTWTWGQDVCDRVSAGEHGYLPSSHRRDGLPPNS